MRHILASLVFIGCGSLDRAPSAPPEPASPSEVLADASDDYEQDVPLLAWLPYDNDLGRFVQPVLQGLWQGSDSGVAVAVAVDRPDQPDIELVRFDHGKLTEAGRLPHEDSGGIEAFEAFLAWASATYEARHMAIAVLDHGGDLAHVSLDENPGDPGPETWLDVRELSQSLARFRAQEPGEVELLMMQVCGKASLEPLKALAPAARFTVASQLPLAAPNTWYRDGLYRIAALPQHSGDLWAEAIAATDDPRMYAEITCVDNAVLSTMAPLELTTTQAALEGPLAPSRWIYAGETYVDLGALRTHQQGASPELDALSCGTWTSPSPAGLLTDGFPAPEALSGLSVAVHRDEGPMGGWLHLKP